MNKVEVALRKYRLITEKINRLLDEKDLLDAKYHECGNVLKAAAGDGMPHGSGISRTTENKALMLAEIAERDEEIRRELEELTQEKVDIESKMTRALNAEEYSLVVEKTSHDCRWDQLAHTYGIKAGVARVRYHRALKKLEKIFA